MRNRKRLSRSKSKKNFRNGAKTHKVNHRQKPMRGGWRL